MRDTRADDEEAARLYDEPDFEEEPRRNWLLNRLGKVPAGVWPFLVPLAIFTALRVRDGSAMSSWLSLGFVSLAVFVFAAALPAAILGGTPRVWQAAPLVLAGAVIWTWPAATIGVLIELQRWLVPEAWPDQPFGAGLGAARDIAALVGLAGPLVVAVGLSKLRRTVTTWPRSLVAVSLLGAVALGVFEARRVLDFYGAMEAGMGGSSGLALSDQLRVILAASRPIELLGLGALAWSSLSAVRAGEQPRRFWALICAGSATLFAVGVYASGLGAAVNAGLVPMEAAASVYTALYWVFDWAALVAYGALLLGFALGLPPDPLDLGDVVATE